MSRPHKVLHLLVPQLLRAADLAVAVQAPQAAYPSLQRALSRARRIKSMDTDDPAQDNDVARLIAQLLGLNWPADRDLPLAALLARAHDIIDADNAQCWAIASPVLLQPDRDRLLLHPPTTTLPLAKTDQQRLIDVFSRHFDADIQQLHYLNDGSWLMAFPGERAAVKTTPLASAMHMPVDGRLPSGEQSRYWRSLFNEMQMLLYQLDSSDMGFNAFWLHGVGAEPDAIQADVTYPGVRLTGNSVLLQALASWRGATVSPDLAGLAAGNESSNESSNETSNETTNKTSNEIGLVAFLPEIAQAVESRSPEALQQAYLALEQAMQLALTWLRRGQITELIIYPLPGDGFRLTRWLAMQFWRPVKPLNQLSLRQN